LGLGEVRAAAGPRRAGDVHGPRGDQRLARDARARVLPEELVEDAVAHLVADLVGVPLGAGVGREQAGHRLSSRLRSGCGLTRAVYGPGPTVPAGYVPRAAATSSSTAAATRSFPVGPTVRTSSTSGRSRWTVLVSW